MRMRETIEAKLTRAFSPVHIVVEDDSHRHAHHAGGRPEGETHFNVTLVSPTFDGLSRVARHRAVHEVLAEELAATVHALALSLHAPGEPGA